MSTSGSKQALLSAIQDQFSNLFEGNISLENLETLVEQTRELYEFAVVVRYKAHEEQLYPERTKQVEEIEQTLDTKAQVEVVEEKIEETIVQSNTEEKEVAQTIFDFSLFDSVPEVEPQKDLDSILNEEKVEQTLVENSSEEEIQEQTNEIEDLDLAQSEVAEPETNDNIVEITHIHLEEEFQVEEKVDYTIEEIASSEEYLVENEETEAYLNEVNDAFNEASQQDDVDLQQENIQYHEVNYSNETFSLEEKEATTFVQVQTPHVEADPILVKLDEIIERASSAMGLSMLSLKLDSLVGSFGFNEKYQFIHELFNGSPDDFNQAVEVLDGFQNLDQAKEQLIYYTKLNAWDLDKEIATEFIRKILRRYN